MALKLSWERELWKSGYCLAAGADEVGRGAWAGPLVAGAVVVEAKALANWRKCDWFALVADSKTLSPQVREQVFGAIEYVVPWAIGVVNNKVIDDIGIAEANRRALQFALLNLDVRPSFALVDYVARLGERVADIPARPVVRGDAKVFSIALASIVAKVQRDRVMQQYEIQYPGYGFGRHKGYGTAAHRAALKELGVCPIHRRSYRPVQAHLV